MAVKGDHLLPVTFVGATSAKGMGSQVLWAKYYLAAMVDGNLRTHIACCGHGKKEKDSSWYMFLEKILSIIHTVFGNEFDIFSDERRSIRDAIEQILPGLERWSASEVQWTDCCLNKKVCVYKCQRYMEIDTNCVSHTRP